MYIHADFNTFYYFSINININSVSAGHMHARLFCDIMTSDFLR